MRQPGNRRGRGRGGGGGARRTGSGSGGRQHTFDSSGPNVKIRGTPAQILEKYLTLARDAMASDDRVTAENYFQHAEHYYRVLNVDGAERSENRGRSNGAEAGNSGDKESPPAAPAAPAGAAASDPATAGQPVVTETKPSGAAGDQEGEDGGKKEPAPA